MTIDYNQQSSQHSRELLADETCRLLFGESTNLLDDILAHPLSIDYFNVYLSLPIFGQRVLYQRIAHQFDFDPPSSVENYEEAKQWLIHCRLNNYIHTDIYIENLLALLLIKTDDSTVEEQSYIFSTVTEVRQFHQFLQSTSGIKYWNFFIDSMRLLRSRRSNQSNRIDISYLNFIAKYYSRKDELHSITLGLDNPSMPNSSTSDTIWFQMAVNAMYQLRIYWLARYLSQGSLPPRFKFKHRTENTIKPISPEEKMSDKDIPEIESTNNEITVAKHTIGNISYIDYDPQQYILIQPSEKEDTDEFNDSDKTNETKIEPKDISPPLSGRSIEDYASDTNLELFYRIFVSDSLAGSPFLEYISQTIPKPDAISYQTCLRFLIDAEIFFSIPYGKFKERILRQFLLRYIQVIATEQLPNPIVDIIEEQRTDLIKELMKKDDNQYSLLSKLLLEVTKFLIPQFLNYIKFDRLRFLVQVCPTHSNLIFEDLRRRSSNQSDSKQIHSNETEFIPKSTCNEQQNDLLNPSIKARYNTTEKLINTDEQCPFRPGERFPPLTDTEIEDELRRFCKKFQWKDVKIVLGKSFNISTTSPAQDHKVQPSIIDEDFKLKSIETFTTDVMNSAREIVEIDRFVTNIIDESLNIIQTTSSFDSTEIDLHSSPLSPVFEEILLTDSSSSSTTKTSPKFLKNNNALKFLSSIGSYFINRPSQMINTNKTDNFFHESIRFAQKDASNEVKDLFITKPTSHFQHNNQPEILELIQNQISNSQWPLEEYIGYKVQRTWRALKLAADISEFDIDFMLNYHRDFDWISPHDNFGSFNQRTSLISPNSHRHIGHQKCHQTN